MDEALVELLLLRTLAAATSATGCWPSIRAALEDEGISAHDRMLINEAAQKHHMDPIFEDEDF